MSNGLRYLLPGSLILFLTWVGLNFASLLTPSKINTNFLKENESIKKETVENVVLQDNEGRAEVIKANGQWRLEGRKVESSKIDEILDLFFNKENVFPLISQNQKSQEQLGVASSSARRLILKDKSQSTLTLIVGKYSFPGNFVRFGDSENIYLSPLVLDALLSPDPQDLWDKAVLRLARSEIKKLTLQKGSKTFKLHKEDDKFFLAEEKKEANPAKVNEYLTTLELLRGEKIITDKKEKKNYPQLLGKVSLETSNQKETLKIYSDKENDLLERTSDDELFTLPSSRSSDILKPQSEFE